MVTYPGQAGHLIGGAPALQCSVQDGHCQQVGFGSLLSCYDSYVDICCLRLVSHFVSSFYPMQLIAGNCLIPSVASQSLLGKCLGFKMP